MEAGQTKGNVHFIPLNLGSKGRTTHLFLLYFYIILIFLLLYFFGCGAFGILVAQPGIELMSPAVEAQSHKYYTIREFPLHFKDFFTYLSFCWVLVAARGLSLVAESREDSLVAIQGLPTVVVSLLMEHSL